ncbi:MAG: AI-2E family transporter [Clostridia bacterium]|nr:AI-2E family transporter [Clostridia bacterium]
MFELNSKNVKKILLIITYTVLLCFALLNLNVVFKVLGYILNLLKPFIYGFCLAFILNIPLSKFENMFKNKKKVAKGKAPAKPIVEKKNTKLRVAGIAFSILIFIGIIFLTLFLVIPEFINTISIFKDNIPEAFENVKEWLKTLMVNYPEITEKITSYQPDWAALESDITKIIKTAATGIIGISIDFVVGLFSGVVNLVMGFVFAIYMLMQKEGLIQQSKRVLRAYLPENKSEKVLRIGSITNDTFKKFFGGQFIEAILLGVLCFIGMKIFGMPYALTISVLVGVTALIPVFGAFFGTAIGAILILAVDPMKAVWFVVYIIVLQQIDGNLIYPKIVGDSVGLPGIWVMLAVLIGGNSLGVIGMLVGVPIASVVYKLIKEHVNKQKIEN